jgi:hypothetical protein
MAPCRRGKIRIWETCTAQHRSNSLPDNSNIRMPLRFGPAPLRSSVTRRKREAGWILLVPSSAGALPRIWSRPAALSSSAGFSRFFSASTPESFRRRMVRIYRLHRSARRAWEYTGAMLAGGRWNPIELRCSTPPSTCRWPASRFWFISIRANCPETTFGRERSCRMRRISCRLETWTSQHARRQGFRGSRPLDNSLRSCPRS